MAGAPCTGPCCPRPASKSIAPNRRSWDFLKRTPEACTNLSCWRFVFCWNGEGIEALAKPIFVRGVAPSMEAALPSPSMAGAPCAFVGNGEGIEELAKPIFVRGYPPSMVGAPCAFVGNGRGDRRICVANLRKRRQPLQWKCASHPSMAVCFVPILHIVVRSVWIFGEGSFCALKNRRSPLVVWTI